MADLITHGALGYLFWSALPRERRGPAATFVYANLLPDLLTRAPAIALTALIPHLGLPPWLAYIFEPMHLPAGMLPLSALLSQLYAPGRRLQAFWGLLGGMALHLCLDLTQDHLGTGYPIGFPLLRGLFELHWWGSEASVPFSLPLLGLALWRARQLRREPGGGP